MTAPRQPPRWYKSSRSQNTTNCIEVGRVPEGTAVRDTKNRGAGYLTATTEQWRSLITALKNGRFDT